MEDTHETSFIKETLQESIEHYRHLVEISPEAVFVCNEEKCLFVNVAGLALVGARDVDEVVGQPFTIFLFPEASEAIMAGMKTALQQKDGLRAEQKIRRLDGTAAYVEAACIPFTFEGLPALQIVARDISERKEAEERLSYLAFHDVLTGLPNRILFKERLTTELARAERHFECLAVVLLDLDRFKEVNDTLGHDIGDRLLQQVALRLKECVRECDTLARISGDEFSFVFTRLASREGAEVIIERILSQFKRPFRAAEFDLYITASIGISLYPNDGHSLDELVQQADMAMYRAKGMGRNAYQFFEREMGTLFSERRTIENHLRKAVDGQQMLAYYQPIVDLTTHSIVGAEALVRWPHAEWGNVPPDHFIELAEDTGHILAIDEWVLHTACAQAAAWQQAGIPPFRLSVNLSAHHFSGDGPIELVKHALQESGLAPQFLELEITESADMRNIEQTLEFLRELRALGVRLAIDDFGVGYSSFYYLKSFPINTIKISKSFVVDMLRDNTNAAIVNAIISVSHSLGRRVVAEYVETDDQLVFLASHGCDEIQGYLIGKPTCADEFLDLLQRQDEVISRILSVADRPIAMSKS